MILCLGATPTLQRTLTFDRLTMDSVNRAASVIESASGKSINVARTLHTLGCPVIALGFVGGDTGRFIRDDLSRLNIAHQFIEVEPRTRTCVTVIDRGGDTVTELVEESAAVDLKRYMDLREAVWANIGSAKALVLSGSLTPGAPAFFYASCTRLARAAGVKVILDGRGEPLREALKERPDIVKPNRQELAETVGHPLEDDAAVLKAIGELLAKGPAAVVVTNGPKDAIVADGHRAWRLTPPAISPVNPIGSGDALAAGLAKALVDGSDLATAAALGMACGAANALSSPPGHAKLADIDRLLSMVRIEPISC